ncbi:MAG: hypothetical protein ACRD0K_10575 [Egibacteraceae bacterium]
MTDLHHHIWSSIPEGDHTLAFTANLDGRIAESDEVDNRFTVDVTAIDCSGAQPGNPFEGGDSPTESPTFVCLGPDPSHCQTQP